MAQELAVRAGDVALPFDDQAKPPVETVLHSAIRVVRRRKLVAIAVFIASIVPSGIFVVRRPPIYEATARLQVERSGDTTFIRNSVSTGPPSDDFFQTQQQLLLGRPVIVRVIQQIKLWESPEFSRSLSDNASPDDVSRSGLVDQFISHLTLSPVANTHILNIAFTANDPSVAMNAVNTLMSTFRGKQLASQDHDSSNQVGWINDRLAEQQKRLASSERALNSYMASHDAVSVEDHQNIVVQKLSDLNTALTRAKTERMNKEVLYRQLQAVHADPNALDALPVVLSNPVLQQLRGQVADLKQKEIRASQELGDRHPELIKLRSELRLAQDRLDTELTKLAASVRNDFVAAQAIEENLTRALNVQKREVLDLNQKSLDYGALQRQATSDRQIYERLLTESQTRGIENKTAEQAIRVVEPAELPPGPIGPHNTRDLLLVVAVGLLLATGVPLGLESLDHRVKTPADIEQRLHLSCLAMVPRLRGTADVKRRLMTNEASGFNEAFRRVRATVAVTGRPPHPASSFLVTSAAPGEGKSLVAMNLAIAFARTGQRVLLLDADLRRPTVHTSFDLEIAPGLTNLLHRDGNAQLAIWGTSIANLFVMTSGEYRPDAAELLSSPNLQTLLHTLESRFSWIILDSPPVGPVADACTLARLVPQTLFVVAADSTTVGAATAAIEQLKAAGAQIGGVVLNRADLDKSAYYYWPYHQNQYSAYYVSHAKGSAG